MAQFTKSQVKALTYAFEKNGALYAPGRQMGGAYRRCCERLVDQFLLSPEPPFKLTVKGLHALREYRAERWAKVGCMAYLDQLREVEAALDSINALQFIKRSA